MTARILREERPDAVFVMTPPVFAALPAFWYAWRRGKQCRARRAHRGVPAPALAALPVAAADALPPRRDDARAQPAPGERSFEAMGAHATLVPDVPIVYDSVEPFARPATPVIVGRRVLVQLRRADCRDLRRRGAGCPTCASS